MHSTFRSEWSHGDGAPGPGRRADGEQSGEKPTFAEQTSNSGVSAKVVLDADT